MSKERHSNPVEQEFTTHQRQWEGSREHAQYEKLGGDKSEKARQIEAETIEQITRAELDELVKEVVEKFQQLTTKNINKLTPDGKLFVADVHQALDAHLNPDRTPMDYHKLNSQILSLADDLVHQRGFHQTILERIEKFFPELVGTPQMNYLHELVNTIVEIVQIRRETAKNREETAKNREETAKNREETAKNREETAKNREETAKNREETAKNREETAKIKKRIAQDKAEIARMNEQRKATRARIKQLDENIEAYQQVIETFGGKK